MLKSRERKLISSLVEKWIGRPRIHSADTDLLSKAKLNYLERFLGSK